MKNIIIIDDDPDLRFMLNEMLKDKYKVVELADVDEVLRLCKKDKVDLIITDLFMPGKNGLELIKEVRKKYPEIRILAISGGNYTKTCDFLPIADLIGANETMHKPFGMKELQQRVDKLVH